MALLTILRQFYLFTQAATPSPVSSYACSPPAVPAPHPSSRTFALTTLQDVEAVAAAASDLPHLHLTLHSNIFLQVIHLSIRPVHPHLLAPQSNLPKAKD